MRIPPCTITASCGLSLPTPPAARKPRAGRICPGLLWGPPPFPAPATVFRGPAAQNPLPSARKTNGVRVKSRGRAQKAATGRGATGAQAQTQGMPRGLLAEKRGQRSPGVGLWASLCARSPAAHGPGPPAAAKRERRSPDRGRRARDGRIRAGSTSCTGGDKFARSASLPWDRKAAFRPGAKRSGSGRPGRGLRNLCSPERRFRRLRPGLRRGRKAKPGRRR